MKTSTLPVPLTPEDRKDLNDLSRTRRTPPPTLGAQFIAEGLRLARFPGIEFRNTPLGRMAYLKNSRLAVWLLRELVDADDKNLPPQRRGWLDKVKSFFTDGAK